MGRCFEAGIKLPPNCLLMTLARIRWQNSKLVTHSFDIYLLTLNVGNSLLSRSLSVYLFVSLHTCGFLFDSVVYNVLHVITYFGAQSAPDLPSGTPFRVTLWLLLTDHTTFLELFLFFFSGTTRIASRLKPCCLTLCSCLSQDAVASGWALLL